MREGSSVDIRSNGELQAWNIDYNYYQQESKDIYSPFQGFKYTTLQQGK